MARFAGGKTFSKKSIVVALGSAFILVSFQNCGFGGAGGGGGAGAIAEVVDNSVGEPGTQMDWSNYEKVTTPAQNSYRNSLQIFAYDDHRVLIDLEDGLYVYDAQTEKFQIVMDHNQFYFNVDNVMAFPSLGRFAVVVEDFASASYYLKIFDATTGELLFTSPALADNSTACGYNPKDEANGKIICVFDRPTSTNQYEYQASSFSVANLKFTMMVQPPSNYVLSSEWYIMTRIESFQNDYPLPKEDKVLVKVYDTSKNVTVDMLLSADKYQIIGDADTYDFAGTGMATTAYNLFHGDTLDSLPINANCPANLSAYSPQYQFRSRQSTMQNALCLDNYVWTMSSNTGLRKCSDPATCSTIQFSGDGQAMKAANVYPVYIEKTKSLLTLSSFSTYDHYLLQSVDVATGVSKVIPLPATNAATFGEQLAQRDQFYVLQSSEVRIYQNTLVYPMRLYVPEQQKFVDLPLIPGSATGYIYWYQLRKVNNTSYLVGYQNVNGQNLALVVGLDGTVKKFQDKIVQDRGDTGTSADLTKVILQSSTGLVYSYDLVTHATTTIAQSPAGYGAFFSSAVGDKTVIIFGSLTNSNDRILRVYQGTTMKYERSASFYNMATFADQSGIVAWFTVSNGSGSSGLAFKFDFNSMQPSADVTCSKQTASYNCRFTQYNSDYGIFLADGEGRIYDQNLTLVMDTGGYPVSPYGYLPVKKYTYAYFAKTTLVQSGDDSLEYGSVWSFDFQTRKLEPVSTMVLNQSYDAFDDYLIIQDYSADYKNHSAKLLYKNRKLIDLPDYNDRQVVGDQAVVFVLGEEDHPSYISVNRDSLSKMAHGQSQSVNVNNFQSSSRLNDLSAALGSTAYWQFPLQQERIFTSTFPNQ